MCLVLAESSIYQPSRTAENWSSGSFFRVITKVVVGQEGRREGERIRETEKGGLGSRYRDTRKKQLASVDSEESRSGKKPDDHFGGSKDHVVRSCLQCSLYQQADLCLQCSGDRCIGSAHESPLVASGKLACSPCSLLLLLGTGISRLVLVSADGGVSVRQCAPIHEGVCGQMVGFWQKDMCVHVWKRSCGETSLEFSSCLEP